MKRFTLFSLLLFLGTATMAQNVALKHLSTFVIDTAFDESAAEIVEYDTASKKLFVINGNVKGITILNYQDPANPTFSSSMSFGFGAPNSVSVYNGVAAVAVGAPNPGTNGRVYFVNTKTEQIIDSVTVGDLPDMLTFSPNGQMIIVANEGEPVGDYSLDPEGSISLIDVSNGFNSATVTTLDFKRFNNLDWKAAAVKRTGPDTLMAGPNSGQPITLAQTLEPEYCVFNATGTKAYVALQENNALAIVDVANMRIDTIKGLGYKDHSQPGNGMDPSNRDNKRMIRTVPVFGMYQPDAIAGYEVGGMSYIVSANEGDSKDEAWSEEVRVKDLQLDFNDLDPRTAQQDDSLGRLNVTTVLGDNDGDGNWDSLYAYGTRSFSIWDENGNLVWDSGDDFERITLDSLGQFFNANNDENSNSEPRSDDKGPEPEAVTVAKINGRHFAFIGLERVGGVMVYDVQNPQSPRFVTYVNNRDFTVSDIDKSKDSLVKAGDLGPECVILIPADQSPNGMNLLVVSSEVSGTVSTFTVTPDFVNNINELMEKAPALSLYPNPVQNQLQLELASEQAQEVQVRVLDIKGRLVQERVLNMGQGQINDLDMSSLPTGTYNLMLNGKDWVKAENIIKQ